MSYEDLARGAGARRFGAGGGTGSSIRDTGGYQAPAVQIIQDGAGSEDEIAKKKLDELHSLEQKISDNLGKIKRLSDVLGTAKDSVSSREKLNLLIENTTMLSRSSGILAKSLSRMRIYSKGQKFRLQKLTTDLQNLLSRFSELSKICAQKERRYPPPVATVTPKEKNAALDQESENVSLIEDERRQQIIQIEQEREFSKQIVEERDASIREIETTISEVNDIFRDLAVCVADQQVMIDNIESNIESSVEKTEMGVTELRKASQHQKAFRTKICCLAVTVVVIACIIVFILLIKN